MNQQSIESKIYYNSAMPEESRKEINGIQTAWIRHASFRKDPATDSPENIVLDMNIRYETWGQADITYSADDITGFMNDMKCNSPEQLRDKVVRAYCKDLRLVGLGAVPEQ